MIKRRQIISKLLNKERVWVTPKNYLGRLKLTFILFAILSAITIALIYTFFGQSFLTLAICAISSLVCIFTIYYSAKHLFEASIKGDILIMNSLTESSKVTSLRSIRRVKTKSVMGLSVTKINYSLDGRNNTVRFINTFQSLPTQPDCILNNAIKKSKKRKANHKPGPVTVN